MPGFPSNEFAEHPRTGWLTSPGLKGLAIALVASLIAAHQSFGHQASLDARQFRNLTLDGIGLGEPAGSLDSIRLHYKVDGAIWRRVSGDRTKPSLLRFDAKGNLEVVVGQVLNCGGKVMLSSGDTLDSARVLFGRPVLVNDSGGGEFYLFARQHPSVGIKMLGATIETIQLKK